MWRFDQGQNTSSSRSQLAEGELQRSVGVEYRTGDVRLHRHPARTEYGRTFSPKPSNATVTNRRIDGVYLAEFDNDTAKLVALSRGTVYGTDLPGDGTFSSMKTGLTDGEDLRLSGTHYNDRHYVTNQEDRMLVIEDDGTVRDAGMDAPTTVPIATVSDASGSATVSRPTANENVTSVLWSSLSSGYDGDNDTFALSAMTTNNTATAKFSAWASVATVAADQVKIRWAMAGAQIDNSDIPGSGSGNIPGTGGASVSSGFVSTVLIEVSEDNGGSFSEAYTETFDRPITTRILAYDIDTATDRNQVQVRVSHTHNSGTSQSALRVYDISIADGSTTAVFTTSGKGIRYCFTEYDSTRGLESPPSPETGLKTFSAQNQVKLENPPAQTNSIATHYRYYRIPDGGVSPFDFGLIGEVAIGSGKSFIDDFGVVGVNEQPGPPLEMVQIGVDRGNNLNPLPFIANQPPPNMDFVLNYDGSLVGFKGRQEFYSMGGRPESWPEVFVISSFPMEANDTIVGAVALDRNLLVAAQGVMIRQESLPRIVSGQFSAAKIREITGAPGCVRKGAVTKVSRGGEQLASWVSYTGVHVSDGFSFKDITDDIDWDANVIGADLEKYAQLFWDDHRDRMHLRFQYAENRYAIIHMGADHTKPGGLPKITWGHYGRSTDYAAARVGGESFVFSGHRYDGNVYRERQGYTDESDSKGDGTWPLDVVLKRKYRNYKTFMVRKARLRHSDGGSAEATVTWRSGSDSDDAGQTRDFTVSLRGDRGTEFSVIQAGHFHEPSIKMTGGGAVSFELIETDEEIFGQSGNF
jgi:hypothetical protein